MDKIELATMAIASPALFHALVHKCNDENFDLPKEFERVFKRRDWLTKDGSVQPRLKEFVLKNVKVKKNKGIQIVFNFSN